MHALPVQSEQEISEYAAQTSKWAEYNDVLLKTSFSNLEVWSEYNDASFGMITRSEANTFSDPTAFNSYRRSISNQIKALEKTHATLELYAEASEARGCEEAQAHGYREVRGPKEPRRDEPECCCLGEASGPQEAQGRPSEPAGCICGNGGAGLSQRARRTIQPQKRRGHAGGVTRWPCVFWMDTRSGKSRP